VPKLEQASDTALFQAELHALNAAPQARDLEGCRVLVTGVTAGIGLATALALVRAGAHVIGTGRRAERLEAIAGHCSTDRAYARGRFVPVVCDMRLPGSFSALSQAGAQEVDILIANAGLARGVAPVAQLEPSSAEEMIDTNLTSTIDLIRQVLPSMIARGSGHILGVGSIAAHQPYENGNVYCATKAALRAFFQCLRQETCGQNVRVSLVSPGLVETEFSQVRFRGDTARAKAVYQGLIPLTASDIAAEILHVLRRPVHVNIDDMILTPIRQGSVYRIAREVHPT
jgi:NADP-dependent 3-hydroxy acid dehydrogenase YdfG